MLVDFLPLHHEESPYLLESGVFHKHVGVLVLPLVLWVVTHQVLGQKDARVEPFFNTRIDLILLSIHQSVDFTGELL